MLLLCLLQDKTAGLFLVTAVHSRPTDTKTLAKLLGLGAKVSWFQLWSP